MYGKGPYTTNGIDGMAFKASKYSQHSDWPDLQLHFLTYSVSSDHGVNCLFFFCTRYFEICVQSHLIISKDNYHLL